MIFNHDKEKRNESKDKKLVFEMAHDADLFSKRPGRDFSRNSKLSFEKTISILLCMQGKSISIELLNFFEYGQNTPSASAFAQARNKLASHTMQTLFQRFVCACEVHHTYKGFRLLAADGSEFSIPQNKEALNQMIDREVMKVITHWLMLRSFRA